MKKSNVIRRISLVVAMSLVLTMAGVLPTGQTEVASAQPQLREDANGYYEVSNLREFLEMYDMINATNIFKTDVFYWLYRTKKGVPYKYTPLYQKASGKTLLWLIHRLSY